MGKGKVSSGFVSADALLDARLMHEISRGYHPWRAFGEVDVQLGLQIRAWQALADGAENPKQRAGYLIRVEELLEKRLHLAQKAGGYEMEARKAVTEHVKVTGESSGLAEGSLELEDGTLLNLALPE